MEPRDGKTTKTLPPINFSKSEIRRRFAALRKERASSVLAELSLQIVENLCGCEIFLSSQKIALYSPRNAEVDILPVLSRLRRFGKRAFFPRVSGENLRFLEVSDSSELVPGSFSIPEPPEGPGREISVTELDLVVAPGICFDRFGVRVGYGGGFYDRATSGLPTEKVCGAAYSFQFVDFELPFDSGDVRVGSVITEHGIFRAQEKRIGEKND